MARYTITLRRTPLAELADVVANPSSPSRVAYYAAAFRAGHILRPIIVISGPSGLLLVDGAHRLAAARVVGCDLDVLWCLREPCAAPRGRAMHPHEVRLALAAAGSAHVVETGRGSAIHALTVELEPVP